MNFIKPFLVHRSQHVSTNGEISGDIEINCGVQQCSLLHDQWLSCLVTNIYEKYWYYSHVIYGCPVWSLTSMKNIDITLTWSMVVLFGHQHLWKILILLSRDLWLSCLVSNINEKHWNYQWLSCLVSNIYEKHWNYQHTHGCHSFSKMKFQDFWGHFSTFFWAFPGHFRKKSRTFQGHFQNLVEFQGHKLSNSRTWMTK